LDNPTESGPSSTFIDSAAKPEEEKLDLCQYGFKTYLRLISHHLSGLPQPNLNRYPDMDYPDQNEDTMEDMEDGENEFLRERTEKEEDERAAHELERYRPHIPIVLPRRKFSGARNVETVKDGRVDFVIRHIPLQDC